MTMRPLILILFGLLACGLLIQATTAPPYLGDEPLWYMRSMEWPTDMRHVEWATDIPAVNRWLYGAALHCIEPSRHLGRRLWLSADGTFAAHRRPALAGRSVAENEAWLGAQLPLREMWAMRYVNVAAFLAGLAFLYLAGRRLKLPRAAALACLGPIVLSPLVVRDVAFHLWSGDIFLFASAALVLWAMLRMPNTTTKHVLLIGSLCGLCVASKHPGVLVCAAYCVYLVRASRGWQRLWNPVGAMAAAFIVFATINPVILLHPDLPPWRVLLAFVYRRVECATLTAQAGNAMDWTQYLGLTGIYWGLMPVFCWLAVTRFARHPQVILWGGCLWIGTLVMFAQLGVPAERYTTLILYGLAWPTIAMLLTTSSGASASSGVSGDRRPAASLPAA
jgi:hypothetical protein